MKETTQLYLQQYLNTLPAEVAQRYTSFSADYFCADQHNADLCAELVARGEKQATCSLEYWYSHENEPMPKVGHLQVVTNWEGQPVCIIETTSVSKSRYQDVSEEFAHAEGEGDKSLAWWRDAHWQFFSDECKELGIEPSQDMLLVLEHFKVVHQ